MLFTAIEYIFLFLPLVFQVYFLVSKSRFRWMSNLWLAIASVVFYGWWNYKFIPILFASIVFNYFIGSILTKEQNKIQHENALKKRKIVLIIGIIFNISLLGYFKYADFFITNINSLILTNIPLIHTILPLGISFFTFTQIAYLVDTYRHDAKEYSFFNYVLFVTFFPHLIAGPILHHKEMMPQFLEFGRKIINWRNIYMGLVIFSIGLAKKLLVADNFEVWATFGFDKIESLSFIEAWVASLSYTFQIYFDFSGYTDMAIGAALFFNINLPINFNSPYKSLSIQEFWRRWHITLSRFLREYIYIPLGGNRSGKVRMYCNLIITFLIGGLWHGAGWTFIVWGALHGWALVIYRIYKNHKIKLPVFMSWLVTFVFINITWVFFRANSIENAVRILKGMFGLNGFGIQAISGIKITQLFNVKISSLSDFQSACPTAIIWIALGLFVVLILPNSQQILSKINFESMPFKSYLVSFSSRIFIHVFLSYILIVCCCVAFYKYGLDRYVYQVVPIKREFVEIVNTQGDYRSNLYVNDIFRGNDKKVIVVGSSFTTGMGSFKFKYNGEEYKSGTIGIGGNSISNALRGVGSVLDTKNLDTIIVGVSPLNMGPVNAHFAFPDQGIGSLNMFGFDFKMDKYKECQDIQLAPGEIWQLATNIRNERYLLLHGFLYNLATRSFKDDSYQSKILNMDDESKNSFYEKFYDEIGKGKQPVKNQENGKDERFLWRKRGIIESLQPNGDVYKAFKKLKTLSDQKRIRLVVYDTPTAVRASQIYPKSFIEEYRSSMKKMTSELGIAYYDLTELVPWKGEFMSDFIHPNIETREKLHEYLLYSMFNNGGHREEDRCFFD